VTWGAYSTSNAGIDDLGRRNRTGTFGEVI